MKTVEINIETEVQKFLNDNIIGKSEYEFNDTLKVGDMFFDKYNQDIIIKISEIRIKDEHITIHYLYNKNFNDDVWYSYGYEPITTFIKRYGNLKLQKSFAEYQKEALELINGKTSLKDYEDTTVKEESTDLISMNSKESYQMIQQHLEKRKKNVELVKAAVGLELEKRKRELENIRSSLGLILDDFRKKIKKIEKVIYTIELYLGIKEDIVQIQEGELADIKTAITFRQEVLCMDEEYGDPMADKQGLDFNNIATFDNWLLSYNNYYKKYNYELIMPEEKGVIALKVRRNDKEYCDNPWINATLNIPNHKTYILIRNGFNIYRIWANINIFPRLFPRKTELQELKDRWDEIIEKSEGSGFSIKLSSGEEISMRNIEESKEKIDNTMFEYKQQFIMLQGLIDRTEILRPTPEHIKIMNPDALDKGLIKFVFDDERKLASGRKSFRQWQKFINSEIKEGSRVFVVTDKYIKIKDQFSKERYVDGKTIHDNSRFDDRFKNDYNTPNRPNTGLYTVYTKDVPTTEIASYTEWMDENYLNKHKHEIWKNNNVPYAFHYQYSHPENKKLYRIVSSVKEVIFKQLIIKFNPGDEIRNWWDRHDDGHERKNRLSWEIYTDDDLFIINYDLLSIEDVEYYMYDRIHRRDYLTFIPVLAELHAHMVKEKASEEKFIELLAYNKQKELNLKIDLVGIIKEEVENFKLNLKWKRSISDDDEKSWHLINKKINSRLKSISC